MIGKLTEAGADGVLSSTLGEKANGRTTRPYLPQILAGLLDAGLIAVEDAPKGGKRWRIVL